MQGKLVTRKGNMAVQLLANPINYPEKPITEIINNGFFKVDRQWTVKYWNKAAEKILGVRSRDIVGRNLWERFSGVLPLNFYAVYHKAFLQDTPVHFTEYWAEMGAWFDVITYYRDNILSVSFKSSSHPAQPGLPVKQLKILTELYRFVTAVTNDCLWEWNLKAGEFFWIDGGHKKVFGYDVENSLIPQSFWESLLHPEDKIRVLTKLSQLINSGAVLVWEDEYRFKRANGDYAYVHDRGHIIYDDDKKASRMIGATQDITARRLTEIQLSESQRKLLLIARQTVNAVIITDAEEKITWVNSAFVRITEYGSKEVIGRKPGSFLKGSETNAQTVQYLREKIKEKQSFDCDILNYSKSGRKYWMHIQGQPLFNKNGNYEGYFAIQTEITEKVLRENVRASEILDWQKEVTNAVLSAQERERADIGKELHDNLNQILGAAKLYIDLAKTDEESRSTCLDKASGYIVAVIEEIRRISKTLAPLGINILGLFESIKILLSDLVIIYPVKIEFHKKGIAEKDLDEKLQLNIFRMVQEQLNNVIKHSKATRVIIKLTRKANEVMLVISDNGEGCDLLKVRRGVGIININSRAELFSGKVTITSMPGQGYTLKVVLSSIK